MKFEQARQFRMPFGKYSGKSLKEIVGYEDGVQYLDFIREKEYVTNMLRTAIDLVLTMPEIQREIKID
jgi:uncharacterized protein (DUF3820 family)